MLEEFGLGNWLTSKLGYGWRVANLSDWRDMVSKLKALGRSAEEPASPPLRVALVGKYVELQDAYISVRESLIHASTALGRGLQIDWINSEDLEQGRGLDRLATANGIVVPGGFGYRGIEGKIVAARYARENHMPYLGLCLGMQVMCIELARHVFASDRPNSTEFDPHTPYPVIDLMPDQRDIADMGGTMRLGAYPCVLQPGTNAAAAYGQEQISERHRHRFEFNNAYREQLSEAGLVIVASRPMAGWWRSPSSATIPGCWAANSIPSSRAVPTGRTHCSRASFRQSRREAEAKTPALPISWQRMALIRYGTWGLMGIVLLGQDYNLQTPLPLVLHHRS